MKVKSTFYAGAILLISLLFVSVVTAQEFKVNEAVKAQTGWVNADGNLDDEIWTKVPVTDVLPVSSLVDPLNFTLVTGEENCDGPTDLSGAFQLAWDEAFFYVGLKYNDDIHQTYFSQFGSGQIWNDDGIEMWCNKLWSDIMNDDMASYRGLDGYTLQMMQSFMMPYNGLNPVRMNNGGGLLLEWEIEDFTIDHFWQTDNVRMVYVSQDGINFTAEIQFSWAKLPGEAVINAGHEMGFSLTLGDLDAELVDGVLVDQNNSRVAYPNQNPNNAAAISPQHAWVHVTLVDEGSKISFRPVNSLKSYSVNANSYDLFGRKIVNANNRVLISKTSSIAKKNLTISR